MFGDLTVNVDYLHNRHSHRVLQWVNSLQSRADPDSRHRTRAEQADARDVRTRTIRKVLAQFCAQTEADDELVGGYRC